MFFRSEGMEGEKGEQGSESSDVQGRSTVQNVQTSHGCDIDAGDLGASRARRRNCHAMEVSWHVTTWLGPGFTKR